MPLPTVKSQKETSLSKQIILVYGRPKIGKSTFCSYFENALFVATEPGLNHLEVFKAPVNSWEGFLEVCGGLASGTHSFKSVIIDTVDNLITYCSDFVCRENKVEHPADLPHGKGWSLITYELNRALTKLYGLGYGVILVSHSKQEEVETKTKKYSRTSIDVGGKNANVILNRMDLILFMDSEIRDGIEVGVVRTKPSIYFDAGDKSSSLPESIAYPLNNPKIAFDTILNSFNKTK